MRSRVASLAILYIKSTFSISLPSREELKKPKTLIKTLGIGLGILFLVADFSFIFVMMNLTMYDGLKSAGLQELMLLNAATTASVLVFVLAFMMALSMFSMSGIESGFLVLPFSSRELLAAKMVLVYLTEALAGVFILAIAMVIYGIKEGQPIMFYVNGLVTAFALPLLPTAISYLILLPLMNASKLFRNKNFILYIGGFLGMGFALAFNFYIQSAMARIGDPASISLFANPDSFISKLGRAWIPSWLAWKALSDASTFGGALAVLGNLAIGLAGFALTVFLFGGVYVRTLRAFNESTFSRKKLLGIGAARGSGRAAGRIFARKSVMRSLVVREIRLMNREPMYLLNGPFVVILMPVLIAIVFIAQRGTMVEVVAGITSLLSGPGGYLVPAALGAFLGSATSIACTAVSRDAKAIPWIKSLPISPIGYFMAKFLHAEVYSIFGVIVGCGAGLLFLHTAAGDLLLAALLALLFCTAFNMSALWLDTAFPKLRWDNPIAAMKQNPNAVIAILGAMGLIGGMSALSLFLSLPRYAYAIIYGGVFVIPILAWVRFYPKFAAEKYRKLES